MIYLIIEGVYYSLNQTFEGVFICNCDAIIEKITFESNGTYTYVYINVKDTLIATGAWRLGKSSVSLNYQVEIDDFPTIWSPFSGRVKKFNAVFSLLNSKRIRRSQDNPCFDLIKM